ncbi:MAG: 3-hydroxyisobutyrate dehydrogenase-like beta-hydroxyacid dehydrogenase [Gammaproteobacteria bacterium]
MQTNQIGFIGLGQMGGSMAANLVKAGVSLRVFDQDKEALDLLETLGAIADKSVEALGKQCDLVFLCLPSEVEVESCLSEAGGLAVKNNQVKTIIDTTTQSFVSTQAFAKLCDKREIAYCDCPVSGLPKRAIDGTLTLMFGGSQPVYAENLHWLEEMGSQILYCGDVGSGQMMKAINNLIYNINIAAFCEMLPLAVKFGLNPETLEALITGGSSRSFASEHFVPRILDGKFNDDFPMQAAYKDILNGQQMASRLNVELPMMKAMTGVYESALDAGFGGEPKSAMIKAYEELIGVKVRRT